MDESLECTPSRSSRRELAGRVAVVTGATSGIGQAIAVELAAAGAAVVVHGRQNTLGASETVGRIKTLRSDAKSLLTDLATTKGREELVRQAWEWKGGVDIWINNAGVDVLTGKWADASFEDKLNRLWQVDVAATIDLARAVGQKMIRDDNQRDPVILNMGWDQAEHGMAGDSGEMFAATKGAVMAFTRSLAQSLAPRVRVHCLAPGWIRTSWADSANDYWQERAEGESLLGRWGTSDDVARVARFLVGPDAMFMSGQVIQVNGGFRFGKPSGSS